MLGVRRGGLAQRPTAVDCLNGVLTLMPSLRDALVEGPRGRRMLYELIGCGYVDSGIRPEIFIDLVSECAAANLSADAIIEADLVRALSSSIQNARYWQGSDGPDVALAHPEVLDVLKAIARAVSDSGQAAWWTSSVDRGHQALLFRQHHYEQKRQVKISPIVESRSVRVDEFGWWSTPTTAPSIGPRLASYAIDYPLGEDELDERPPTRWVRGQVPTEASVYELDSLDAWKTLVNNYGVPADPNRRESWARAAGIPGGSWIIPDWDRVAEDYDAVHLPVAAYCAVSGVPAEVEGGHALLAGWSPDECYWLRNKLLLETNVEIVEGGPWSRP